MFALSWKNTTRLHGKLINTVAPKAKREMTIGIQSQFIVVNYVGFSGGNRLQMISVLREAGIMVQ